MKVFVVLMLVSQVTWADKHGRFERFCSRGEQGRSDRGFICTGAAVVPPAAFEFATTSGTGMFSTPCSGTTPTGTLAQPMTFARASSAMCTKTAAGGLSTTGIANNDLVFFPNNFARVEYDNTGVLGLLVEPPRNNLLLRSQELENAVWAINGTVTRTANAATAPDGTATAERLTFPACPGSSENVITQAHASAGPRSLYIRGFSGSGAISICTFGGAPNVCQPCSYVNTSWTRCNLVPASAATTTVIGCESQTATYPGASNTGAADIFAWGAQAEDSGRAFSTAYIPTTSATALRVSDAAYFAGLTSYNLAGSMAATVTMEGLEGDTGILGTSGGVNGLLRFPGSTDIRMYTASVASAATTSASLNARFAGYWGATTGACVDGTCVAGPAGGIDAYSALMLLDYYFGVPGQRDGAGIITRVCLDPDPTRCR